MQYCIQDISEIEAAGVQVTIAVDHKLNLNGNTSDPRLRAMAKRLQQEIPQIRDLDLESVDIAHQQLQFSFRYRN